MKYHKELRIRLFGDRDLASRYVGIARKFLGMLNNQMSMGHIKQNTATHRLSDGTVIVARNILGLMEVIIDARGTKKEEWLPLKGFVGIPTELTVVSGNGVSTVLTAALDKPDTITNVQGSLMGVSTYTTYSTYNPTYVNGIDYGQIRYLESIGTEDVWELPGATFYNRYGMGRYTTYVASWQVLKNGEPWSLGPYLSDQTYGITAYGAYVFVVVFGSGAYEVWRKPKDDAMASWVLAGSFFETDTYIITRFVTSPSGQKLVAVYAENQKYLEITISDTDSSASFAATTPVGVSTAGTFYRDITASGNVNITVGTPSESGTVVSGVGTDVAGSTSSYRIYEYSYSETYDQATGVIFVDYNSSNEVILLLGRYNFSRSIYYNYTWSLARNWTFASTCVIPREGYMEETSNQRINNNDDVLFENRVLVFPDGSEMELSGKTRSCTHGYVQDGIVDASFSYPTHFSTTSWGDVACGYGMTVNEVVAVTRDYMRQRMPVIDVTYSLSDPTPSWSEYTLLDADLSENVYLFARITHSVPFDTIGRLYASSSIDYTEIDLVLLDNGVMTEVATAGSTKDLEYAKWAEDVRAEYFNFADEYPSDWTSNPYGGSGTHSEHIARTLSQMMYLAAGNPSIGVYHDLSVIRNRKGARMLTAAATITGPDSKDDGVGAVCTINGVNVADAYGVSANGFYLAGASLI